MANDAISQASRDVLAERERQITGEGWTPEHDDTYTDGELAKAAASYALIAAASDALRSVFGPGEPSPIWPLERHWWKPKDRRRELVKAAALILAEIERLDRLAQLEETTHGLLDRLAETLSHEVER